jgi:hypothetical protein
MFIFFILGSASLIINPSKFCVYYGGSLSVIKPQNSFKENSTVNLEFNSKTKTLHFFVDDIQLSHCIVNINTTPLCFGISGKDTSSSVEIISFFQLNKTTVDNNIKCKETYWGTGKNDKNQLF